MSQTTNGTLTTTNTQTIDTTALKTRKPRIPKLFIDAGSTRTKFYLDKISESYQSVAREFNDSYELPTGYLGVFTKGKKGYAIGDSALSLSGGKLHEGYSDDNKIKLLSIWIIGALTTHPTFLFKVMKKQKTGLIEIDLELAILSLSNHRKKEIEKQFSDIQFTFDEREFKINIANYSFYPEGYGAACAAKKWLKTKKLKDKRFHVLDLGGGTLTLTPYSNLNGVPRGSNQNAVSGAGVMAITEFFGNEATKGDTGGNIYHLSRLKETLEASEIVDNNYSAQIFLGDTEQELGDRLYSGLETWTRQLIGVREILRDIKQIIRRGERVFLTGGGFAIETIKYFIQNYLGSSPLIVPLDNPQDVNITGIK